MKGHKRKNARAQDKNERAQGILGISSGPVQLAREQQLPTLRASKNPYSKAGWEINLEKQWGGICCGNHWEAPQMHFLMLGRSVREGFGIPPAEFPRSHNLK